jgi:hypothetical protein
LGTEGSGGSCTSLRNVFYFGKGSLTKYKCRVATAIVDCLGSDYYAWPDEQERDEIAAEMEARYNLRNCIGVIDGTLFLLAFKPQSSDAGDYCGRKGDSITNLIVSDHKRRIRYYISGWPGGSHDNRVMRNCRLSQCPHEFFSVGEYIIGDSAFQCKWYLIPSFKEFNNTGTSAMRQRFNSILTKGRAISEHTNGILKGRFAWLRSIRQIITNDPKSMKNILLMVHCSVLLHNFLIEEGDDGTDFEEEYENYKAALRAKKTKRRMRNKEGSDDSDSSASIYSLDEELDEDLPGATRRTQLMYYLENRGIIN